MYVLGSLRGDVSTAAASHTRTRCTAFGHRGLPGLLRHRVQENQTSLTIPSQWLFKGHEDVVSHHERRHSTFGRCRSPCPSVFVLLHAETPRSHSATLGGSHEHPSLLYLQLFYKSPPGSSAYLLYFFQLLGGFGGSQ